MSDAYVPPSNIVSRAGAGVVGGIAGGVVLAAVLQFFDRIAPVGQLVGNASSQVGWVILLMICAVAGCLYGALVGREISAQIVPAVGIGIFYGGFWWILLQLVAIPSRTGGTLFALGDDSMIILGAYVAFGVVLGIVYAITGPRRRYQRGRRLRDNRPYRMAYPMPRARRRRRESDD